MLEFQSCWRILSWETEGHEFHVRLRWGKQAQAAAALERGEDGGQHVQHGAHLPPRHWGGAQVGDLDRKMSNPEFVSLSCSFFHLGEKNLVVAGADVLRVFQMVPEVTFVADNIMLTIVKAMPE